MKTILLLLLCVPAYATPFPLLPTVKRPAPLESPKAASAPKTTPMRKLTTTSTSYPSTMVCAFTRDINILHCDTNNADCFLYDQTHVAEVQRAGYVLTILMTDAVAEGALTEVGWYPAAPFERESGFDWFHPAYDRVPHRVFVARQSLAPTGLVPASAAPRANPALKGLTLWTRPK